MDKQEAIEKIKNFPRWNLDDQWLAEKIGIFKIWDERD